ncbi:hypothetical protein [Streptomyces sp. KLOTTS4A1]|uniref:hypothetical protein n=1 Tax=Streptomyces sp. KLOTTS4A1 TaxID=3390996 RepID=UPI0039F52598
MNHPDAPLVANELYVAILGSGAPVVDMQISTAGRRVRITACGADPLSVLYSNGPGWALVVGLAHASGLTTDKRGLWAQLGAQR